MGWVILLLIIVGDVYLYVKGYRPKDSMWTDDKFGIRK